MENKIAHERTHVPVYNRLVWSTVISHATHISYIKSKEFEAILCHPCMSIAWTVLTQNEWDTSHGFDIYA